jgi:hypothetical protein
MTALRPVDHFVCERCTSPSITFPDEIHDAAELHCAGCGTNLGSWYALPPKTNVLGHVDELNSHPAWFIYSDSIGKDLSERV